MLDAGPPVIKVHTYLLYLRILVQYSNQYSHKQRYVDVMFGYFEFQNVAKEVLG